MTYPDVWDHENQPLDDDITSEAEHREWLNSLAQLTPSERLRAHAMRALTTAAPRTHSRRNQT